MSSLLKEIKKFIDVWHTQGIIGKLISLALFIASIASLAQLADNLIVIKGFIKSGIDLYAILVHWFVGLLTTINVEIHPWQIYILTLFSFQIRGHILLWQKNYRTEANDLIPFAILATIVFLFTGDSDYSFIDIMTSQCTYTS